MPLELQAKLLRVLENGEYQRIGETQTRKSRARIVAATNRDLRAEVRAGKFRSDLYHRLSVFAVQVPPLRDLNDDKHLLRDHLRSFMPSKLDKRRSHWIRPHKRAGWITIFRAMCVSLEIL